MTTHSIESKLTHLQNVSKTIDRLKRQLVGEMAYADKLRAEIGQSHPYLKQLLNGTREVATATPAWRTQSPVRQARRVEVVAPPARKTRGTGLRRPHHKVPRVYWEQALLDFIKAAGKSISVADYVKFAKINSNAGNARLTALVESKKLISVRDPNRPQRNLYSLA